MAMLGFESTAEFFVYLTFIFFGMSVMNVTNAIYSIPDYFSVYYQFVKNDEKAKPVNASFWEHMFTYYNVVVFTMQVVLEAFMLTPLGRRIPISWRLIFGLTIPMGEIIAILVIPEVGGSEAGAMATVMIVAFVGGISKTLCDSSNAALAGPFPTKFYGAIVWGLAVSGLITSFMSVVIKAAMEYSFKSRRVQSQIYFGLVMLLQVVACVLLVLLRKNPYAIKYAAEFRYAARKDGKTDDGEDENDAKGTGPADEDGYPDEKENKNVLNADIDPDKMKDTDQVEGTTNAQQMLDASVMVVVKRIWPMLLSCFFVFFATLLIFPGVFFAVKDKTTVKNFWYYTIIVAMFNLGDFLSRLVLQFKRLHVSPRMVMIGSFARALLIIPLALCVPGTIPGVWLPYTVSLLWGLTNGYFGGLSMIYGPRTGSLTTAGQRSLAAICINVALLLGLFAGAMFALAVKEGLPKEKK